MSHANGGAESPLATVFFDRVRLEPDPVEILRYLGCPAGKAPNAKILQRIEQAIDSARGVLRARGICTTYRILSSTRRRLRLVSGDAFTGPVREYLGRAQRIAVFLTTVGPGISWLAQNAMHKGDVLGGLVFNAIGSHIADAMVRQIASDLSSRLAQGESITLPFSPGCCGIPLTQQRTIFRLLDASRLGVELLPTLQMKPVKSVSGFFGIGAADVVKLGQNPCDRCSLIDCQMRR
jgi:hypothetical protein